MIKILRLAACGIGAALTLAAAYLFVPPPRHAAAQFADQGAWAGTATSVTSGSPATTTVTITLNNVSSLSDIEGVNISFNPPANSTGAVSIVVTGSAGTTASTALQRPSSLGLVALSMNELWAGETTSIKYNGSVFVLTSNVDMTRIGDTVQYRGSAVPRGTLVEDGSCVSQTTYAPLFGVIGTTYGSCGSGLFALPDSRGTGFVALDGQGANGLANRITTATCATPNAVGICGAEKSTVAQTNLPNVSLTTNVSDTRTWSMTTVDGVTPGIAIAQTGTGFQAMATTGSVLSNVVSVTGGSISASTPLGGSGTALPVLSPASFGRRAIKF